MPSNADLIKTAGELAHELDLALNTDGLKNDELVALVSDLRAKKTDRDTLTAADADADAPKTGAEAAAQAKADAAREREKAPKRPPFYVAPRKAITSKRGILSGDTADEVKAEYLAGGQKAVDAFVASGHILKG